MKRWTERIAIGYFLLLTFLLPLKFSSLAVAIESSAYFPSEWWGYVLVAWPSATFTAAAGLGLLLMLCIVPVPHWNGRSTELGTVLGWGTLLVLGALPGFYGASCMDFPVFTLVHLLGVAAYAWTAFLLFSAYPVWRERLPDLLVLGVLLVAALGLEQYFISFEETRRMVELQREQGMAISDVLLARVADDRVFSTMAGSGALAGYLLLLSPLALHRVWRWCGRIQEKAAARMIFVPLAALLLGSVFLLARSRAAFLALAMGVALAALAWPMARRWKVALVALSVCVIIGGALYIHHRGRGFESMEARADYIRSSVILLVQHPVLGAGWGEFFHKHTRLKQIQSNEAAHDPHNIVLSYAAQCGVPGLLAILFALGFPLWRLARKLRREFKAAGRVSGTPLAILIGYVLFVLHALMDMDFLIAGSLAAAAALLLSEAWESESPPSPPAGWIPRLALAVAASFTLGTGVWAVAGEYEFERLQTLCRPFEPGAYPATPPEVERQRLALARYRPWSPFGWAQLGDYYQSRREPDRARECYKEALKRSPERAGFHLRLFHLELAAGNADAAMQSLRKVYEFFPGHPEHMELFRKHAPAWLENEIPR